MLHVHVTWLDSFLEPLSENVPEPMKETFPETLLETLLAVYNEHLRLFCLISVIPSVEFLLFCL